MCNFFAFKFLELNFPYLPQICMYCSYKVKVHTNLILCIPGYVEQGRSLQTLVLSYEVNLYAHGNLIAYNSNCRCKLCMYACTYKLLEYHFTMYQLQLN